MRYRNIDFAELEHTREHGDNSEIASIFFFEFFLSSSSLPLPRLTIINNNFGRELIRGYFLLGEGIEKWCSKVDSQIFVNFLLRISNRVVSLMIVCWSLDGLKVSQSLRVYSSFNRRLIDIDVEKKRDNFSSSSFFYLHIIIIRLFFLSRREKEIISRFNFSCIVKGKKSVTVRY